MATHAATPPLRRPRAAEYRRVLVPLVADPEAGRAVALACDLAAEHGSTVTALCVIEVQAELPLGADMREDEIAARRLLSNAQAIGDLYGIDVTVSTVRARAAGPAIVELAGDAGAEIVVLGPRRKPRVGRRAFAFGQTVAYVLAHAPCRVMLVAGPQGR